MKRYRHKYKGKKLRLFGRARRALGFSRSAFNRWRFGRNPFGR